MVVLPHKISYNEINVGGKYPERTLPAKLFQPIHNDQLKQKINLLAGLPHRGKTTNGDIELMKELSIAGNASGLFCLATATYSGDKIGVLTVTMAFG